MMNKASPHWQSSALACALLWATAGNVRASVFQGLQFDFSTGEGSMADDISPAHPASSINNLDGSLNLGGQGLLPASSTTWNTYAMPGGQALAAAV